MSHFLKVLFSSIRLVPHIVIFLCFDRDGLVKSDVERWASIYFRDERRGAPLLPWIKLMTLFPEYRNLFYYRIGSKGNLVKWLCRPIATLFIITPDIGPGLFIQHGFATIIGARRIGANCWINQQVTIGYSAKDEIPPAIGDNVTINAGAKIIGNVSVGDNSIIGANAVVVKDVPPNVTVVGGAARIVRRDGVRVNEKL